MTIVSWAGYNLWRISGQVIPNSSYFLEIDFASKCFVDIKEESGRTWHEGSIGNLLRRLSNGASEDIWSEMEGVTVHGRDWMNDQTREHTIVLFQGNDEESGRPLTRNDYYY
jgi:hypothetical protein